MEVLAAFVTFIVLAIGLSALVSRTNTDHESERLSFSESIGPVMVILLVLIAIIVIFGS